MDTGDDVRVELVHISIGNEDVDNRPVVLFLEDDSFLEVEQSHIEESVEFGDFSRVTHKFNQGNGSF